MAASAPRLKAGKVYKARDWPEQHWSYAAMVSGRVCQRYIAAGGGGFARPYPASDLVKSGGYWRWHHPWVYRQRALFRAGVAKTIAVTCVCTTDLAPRPAIRLLASPALGITEQVASLPAGPNVERSLALTATATVTGVAWVQIEWLAVPGGKDQQDWCGWGTVTAT